MGDRNRWFCLYEYKTTMGYQENIQSICYFIKTQLQILESASALLLV